MKFSPKRVLCTIPVDDLESHLDTALDRLKQSVKSLLSDFVSNVSPESSFGVERRLFESVFAFSRDLLEQTFNSLEAAAPDLPPVVNHRDNNYRHLKDTKPREVVTRFGEITLVRSRYRRGRCGKTIFPLEIALGLQQGFTPAAASLVGKQFAATGSSQGRTIEFAKEHLVSSIGTTRLRKLGQHLAVVMEPFREQCQLEQLQRWLTDARKSKANSVVLSVSRDAVSLGLAPFGFFKMASVATISVLADGKRLGTVYLGRTPETNQKTLSSQLSSLLRLTIKSCVGQPHVVYVTDAGKVETAYWKNVLSKFYVDGQRIKVYRVVDYYHASERLTTIADCLKFGKKKQARRQWLERMRKLLKQKGGHGRSMRSIAEMKKKLGIKAAKKDDFNQAVGYLKNQKRFMNYFAMKAKNFPIGSGVVESACKQVVSERMKLSGMRWKNAGAQAVMTLRCILLSDIWNNVFDEMLKAISPVTDMTENQNTVFPCSEGA